MFGQQMTNTTEQLMNMLRHFSSSGAIKGMDGIQAELWRRNLSQQQYVEWLKNKKEKENVSVPEPKKV
jgi:hypothetical protein